MTDYMDTSNLKLETEEWSDNRCFEIASQESFPAIVNDIKVQKNIISHYLNFYLGGKIQKGLSARDLAFAVISIMPISLNSEEFIWTDTEYNENGNLFFVSPDDRLKYDINNVVNKRSKETNDGNKTLNDKLIEENNVQTSNTHQISLNRDDDIIIEASNTQLDEQVKDANDYPTVTKQSNVDKNIENKNVDNGNKTHEIEYNSDDNHIEINTSNVPANLQWYRLKLDQVSNVNPHTELNCGPVENAAFCIYCNAILDSWDTNVNSRIFLKYFFAMAALFLMRGIAKTYKNISRYFSTKFVEIFGIHELKCYTTPHRGFIKKSWKAFRENDQRIGIMFAKLVVLSLLDQDRLDKYGKVNIMKFAILSHTSYTGMGIINMLQQLASLSLFQFEIVFKFLYSEETAVSWNRVNEFFKKYLAKEAKQYTFHWAAIIDGDSVKHLSCSNNYELAAVIAIFIEETTNSVGIWNAAWVNSGNNLEECKQLGHRLYNDFTQYKKTTPLGKLQL